MRYLTVGDISRATGLPSWKVRRIIDRLGELPRAGGYRLVDRRRLHEVKEFLTSPPKQPRRPTEGGGR